MMIWSTPALDSPYYVYIETMETSMTPVEHLEIPPAPYGTRLRLGVIIPSANTICEPQLQAMVPSGVSLHMTRLKLVTSSEAELLAMAEQAEEAAALLADAAPGRILFHCTTVATYKPDLAAKIRQRITLRTGIVADTTAEAIVESLNFVKAKKIVLITPYTNTINNHEIEFLNRNGFEVVNTYGHDISSGRAFADISPGDWFRAVLGSLCPEADAYFLSSSQARTAEIVELSENKLGVPVITSNTAALWYCLRQAGIRDEISGFGRLLRL